MTKSNVHSVRQRRTNQRIARQYDQVQQDRVRSYQQHQRVRNPERKKLRQWFAESARRIVQNFKRWVKRFFSTSNPVLSGLDLRGAGADRFGAFDPGRRRNAGAHQLRAWFPGLGKMVSTRDGKPV